MIFRRKRTTPVWIDPETAGGNPFPDPATALNDPEGLLALGGNLEPATLLAAYRHGIYPWYGPGECIQWWTPNPRMVLCPIGLKISRSLRRAIRRKTFSITIDQDFPAVIQACAEPRGDDSGTWIDAAMIDAYCRMHELGYAHSVEAWCGEELVGGLYGMAIGCVFFGESMFSRRTDASKVCLAHIVDKLDKWNFQLIDCQMHTSHLEGLGATLIARSDFDTLLDQYCELPPGEASWA